MTQEEVDLIYDYLHENYEYEDGNLIRINNNKFHKKGTSLGSYFYNCKTPYIKVTLNIKQKNMYFPLSHLIWIYFNKEIPEVINYKDGNSVNNRFDNLEHLSKTQMQHKKRELKEFKGYKENKLKDGTPVYRAIISLKGTKISLGQYKTISEALYIYYKAKEIILNNKDITCDELRKKFRVFKYPKGVTKKGSMFVARINRNNKRIFIGSFKSMHEAHNAYLNAKSEINK
jgi:hypothetical protein